MSIRIDVSINFPDSVSHQGFIDDARASGRTPEQYLTGLLDIELPPLKVNQSFDIANPLASLGYTSLNQ